MNLKPNIQYICTKSSKDGTYQKGHKIVIYRNYVINRTTGGFGDAGRSFYEAEWQPDKTWLENAKRNLRDKLSELEEIK